MPLPKKETRDKLIKLANSAAGFLSNNYNLRDQLFQRDKAYYREASGISEKLGDEKDVKTMDKLTIPVVMPQVEGALAYLSDTFLGSYPIFPVVSKPQVMAEALQMETIIQDNSVRFGWVPELLLAMRDGLKYNLCSVEVEWESKSQPKVTNAPLEDLTRGTTEETYYEGNRIKRLNPYNTIYDTRVSPHEQAEKAAFNGYVELWTREQLKKFFEEEGDETFAATEAFESGSANYSTTLSSSSNNYFIPEVNPQALKSPTLTSTDWLAWAGLETGNAIRYHNMYEVLKLYVRIIPREFGIQTKNSGKLHIYELYIVNRSVLIYMEEYASVDGTFPIKTAQLLEDGLGWQTKSFAENAIPFQAAASALYNSGIASQRRKVYDRLFYDPSMFNKKDMDNVDPVARIPSKAQAYGRPLQNGVFALQYRDENVATILSFARDVTDMADIANGQNRVARGQFQKGNKSRTEFNEVMDRSDARNVMMAMFLEHRFFVPIKELIKLNILQYQLPAKYYSPRTKSEVAIDPVQLRNSSVQFQLADGMSPVSRLLNLEAFNVVAQMAATNPQMNAEYDIMGMLMYSLQLQGAGWIQDFKRPPEQMQQQQAQMAMQQAAPSQ
jgi:hypothetical protein